jgi:O-antigen ligase
MLLASCAFLPAACFHSPAWRGQVTAAGVNLPSTLSPQPHASFEALLLLAAGIVWVAWLDSQTWSADSRRVGVRIIAGGVVLLAVAILLARIAHWRIPLWRLEPPIGPFPNRNHTGNLLAVGGIAALGCAADVVRRNCKQAVGWGLGVLLIGIALVLNYSRGGVLVFFIGCVIWIWVAAWNRRSWPILMAGLSAVLVAAAIVLIAGGPTAARFAGGANSEVVFRPKIWRDTLALIRDAPWCGSGLSTFSRLFPFYRGQSIIQEGVLHPESDWLWLVAEEGWLAAVLAIAALEALVLPAFPFERGTRRSLRMAALAAGIAAAAHGFIDVPGHHLGSVLPALFILAAARKDTATEGGNRWARLIWICVGVALIGAALWWRVQVNETDRAEALAKAGHLREAEAAANRAISQMPLDWRAWFVRAGVEANTRRPLAAVADFRRARLLEPTFAGVPLEEGRFWLRREPRLALQAWAEALRRLGPPEDEEIFGLMMAEAPDDRAFRSELFAMVKDRPPLLVDWFVVAPDDEAASRRVEVGVAAAHVDAKHQAAFLRRQKALAEEKP